MFLKNIKIKKTFAFSAGFGRASRAVLGRPHSVTASIYTSSEFALVRLAGSEIWFPYLLFFLLEVKNVCSFLKKIKQCLLFGGCGSLCIVTRSQWPFVSTISSSKQSCTVKMTPEATYVTVYATSLFTYKERLFLRYFDFWIIIRHRYVGPTHYINSCSVCYQFFVSSVA